MQLTLEPPSPSYWAPELQSLPTVMGDTFEADIGTGPFLCAPPAPMRLFSVLVLLGCAAHRACASTALNSSEVAVVVVVEPSQLAVVPVDDGTVLAAPLPSWDTSSSASGSEVMSSSAVAQTNSSDAHGYYKPLAIAYRNVVAMAGPRSAGPQIMASASADASAAPPARSRMHSW